MKSRQLKVHKKLILKGKAEIEYQDFLKKLGENIRTRRTELALTQDDMDSHPLPIDERNFRRIEAGKQNLTAKTFFAICKQLKVQPRDLLDFQISL